MIKHETRNWSGATAPGTSAIALSLEESTDRFWRSSRPNVNKLQQLASKRLQIGLARSLMVLALKQAHEYAKCQLNRPLWKLLLRTNEL